VSAAFRPAKGIEVRPEGCQASLHFGVVLRVADRHFDAPNPRGRLMRSQLAAPEMPGARGSAEARF
jgi:hypothetical protein